eukprot:6939403-Prymnesium_polylepis.2
MPAFSHSFWARRISLSTAARAFAQRARLVVAAPPLIAATRATKIAQYTIAAFVVTSPQSWQRASSLSKYRAYFSPSH